MASIIRLSTAPRDHPSWVRNRHKTKQWDLPCDQVRRLDAQQQGKDASFSITAKSLSQGRSDGHNSLMQEVGPCKTENHQLWV